MTNSKEQDSSSKYSPEQLSEEERAIELGLQSFFGEEAPQELATRILESLEQIRQPEASGHKTQKGLSPAPQQKRFQKRSRFQLFLPRLRKNAGLSFASLAILVGLGFLLFPKLEPFFFRHSLPPKNSDAAQRRALPRALSATHNNTLPKTLKIGQNTRYRWHQEAQGQTFELLSGSVFINPQTPKIIVAEQVLDQIQGRALLVTESPLHGEKLTQLQENFTKQGIVFTDKEKEMLKQPKRWIQRGAFTLCLLSGSFAIHDGNTAQVIKAQEMQPGINNQGPNHAGDLTFSEASNTLTIRNGNDQEFEDLLDFAEAYFAKKGSEQPALFDAIVFLENVTITLKSIELLVKRYPKLKGLYFYGISEISNSWFEAISQLSSLEALKLHDLHRREKHYAIDYQGLEKLSGLSKLKRLVLSNAVEFDNQVAQEIAKLTSLEELDIRGGTWRTNQKKLNLDDQGVQNFVALSNLQILSIHYASLTPQSINILSALQSLKELDLTGNDLKTLSSGLFQNSNIQKLNLSWTNASDHAFTDINNTLPSLQELTIDYCTSISAKGVQSISKLAKLEKLSFKIPGRKPSQRQSDGLDDQGARELAANAHNLKILRIGSEVLSDAGLQELSKMTWLQELDIRECYQISEEAKKKLYESLPDLERITDPQHQPQAGLQTPSEDNTQNQEDTGTQRELPQPLTPKDD